MPPPEARIRAGRWLAAQRKERGLQQGTLARRLGVSQQSVSSYENGRVWVPDDVAAKIASLFELPESTVRHELGLHVPGDIDVAIEPIPMPVVDREVIELPPGVRLTAAQRRAVVAMVIALVSGDVDPAAGGGQFLGLGSAAVTTAAHRTG